MNYHGWCFTGAIALSEALFEYDANCDWVI